MKKLLPLILGLGLFSHQALAVTTVLGNDFAGYVDSVVSTGGALWIDTGGISPEFPAYSNLPADINANITDLDERSWVVGNSAGAYLDLAFNVGVVDGAGADLKIFLVGNNGHKFDLTIGSHTETYVLGAGVGDTGFKDDLYGTDPVVALEIDLLPFGLTGPVDQFRLTIGDGWCDVNALGICSAVPSFVGAYNVVPVPAAVWLFGSGLVGLAGIARKRA